MMKTYKMMMRRVFRNMEFRLSFTILLLFSTGTFLYSLSSCTEYTWFSAYDYREYLCFANGSRWGTLFFTLFPFFCVLPCAASYSKYRSNDTVLLEVNRCGCRRYTFSFGLCCFSANFISFFIPLLINFILCWKYFPHNNYTPSSGDPYQEFAVQYLTGSRFDMPVLKNGIPFLSFYFEHTLLYYLAVIIFIAAVAGIFGMFVLACSYFISKARILLFLPLFLLVRIFSVLDQAFQNRVLESGGVYINLDLMSYMLVLNPYGQYYPFFFAVLICMLLFWWWSSGLLIKRNMDCI